MDGIIIINKEKGYTSHDVVQIVKKIFNEKVGHTGTLDPMATGVLPLLIGKGTLISKYLVNHDKTYIATIKLGESTDTGDSEGNIIQEKNVDSYMLEKEYITKKLNSFLGKQKQIPPMYSAIKVNGKKLYEYARKGEKVDIQPREITIHKINLININKDERKIKIEVSCSKGTYIRTLSEDIAKSIGTVGYMSNLQRTKVGNFDIENAITINQLKENNIKNFISIEEFFVNCSKIILDSYKLHLFCNGVKLSYNYKDGIYRIYAENTFIGIGIIEEGKLKRDIIIIKNS